MCDRGRGEPPPDTGGCGSTRGRGGSALRGLAVRGPPATGGGGYVQQWPSLSFPLMSSASATRLRLGVSTTKSSIPTIRSFYSDSDSDDDSTYGRVPRKSLMPPVRLGYGSCGTKVVVRANHFLVRVSDTNLNHYDQ